MSQPNKYKHYLRFWDGADWYYYTLDGSGTLFQSLTKTETKRAPEGWKDYVLGWQRGWQYLGIMRTYSLPLKFIKEEAKILRSLFLTLGIEAKCELLVEVLEDATRNYKTLFRGDLDFKTYDDKFDNVVIVINEGGFVAKLKARESTNYSYPIATDPYMRWIKVPSINLQSTINYIVPDSIHLTAFGSGIYPRSVYTFTEGTNLDITPYDVAPPSTSWFIRNRSPYSFNVDIKTKIRVKITTPNANVNNGEFFLHRSVFNTNTSGVITGLASSTDIYFGGTQAPGTVVEYVIDQTDSLTLNPLQIVEYSFQMTLAGGGSSGVDGFETTFTTGEIKVYHVGPTKSQYVPCLPAARLFFLLMQSISDDATISTVSDLLTTKLSNQIYFSSGDGVRNLEGAVINTNFKDFFDFFKSDDSASLQYDRNTNTVHLEGVEAVFDPTQVLDIGEVKSCSITPFTEELFVNLRIGGPSKTLDEVNGKDAINMTSEFLSPLTRITGDRDMVSGYVTEMYDIVMTMQNLSGKETVDADTDNEIMVLHANDSVDGTFKLEPSGVDTDYSDVIKIPINLTPGSSYWEIQNVFSPETLFNIRFSPKRRLMRNGRYLRSLLWFNDTEYLKFQVSSKNKVNGLKMITLEGATPDIINEGSDILIADLCPNDQLLCYPFLVNVVAKDEFDLYELIESHPYQYIKATYLGINIAFFILDGSVKPSDRSECKFMGLATTNYSPTTLIR